MIRQKWFGWSGSLLWRSFITANSSFNMFELSCSANWKMSRKKICMWWASWHVTEITQLALTSAAYLTTQLLPLDGWRNKNDEQFFFLFFSCNQRVRIWWRWAKSVLYLSASAALIGGKFEHTRKVFSCTVTAETMESCWLLLLCLFLRNN